MPHIIESDGPEAVATGIVDVSKAAQMKVVSNRSRMVGFDT